MASKLIIKLILNGVIVVPLLLTFTEASITSALLTAVLLSLVAFVIGDQLILRVSNNTIATICDAALAFVFLRFAAYAADWSLSTGELLIIVLVLGLVEAMYHRMLRELPAR
ncbi:DUF2512 family protein [Paenibacillus chitinolyticus]|uniref:DUF2512 family protein n=1 Tax=Paenibacillus chitinolyticus TaxID=79263 RepID=UPI00386E466F